MRKAATPLNADAISVTHHAGMLARLRGRAFPTLDDIHDALVTCCCKGNPKEEGQKLQGAMDAAGIGNAIGKVTSKLGRLPIVNDFHTQLSDLELGEVLGAKKLSVRLDSCALAARRSAFRIGLSSLKPFAAKSATAATSRALPRGLAAQVGPEDRAESDRAEPVRGHSRVSCPGPAASGDCRGWNERRADVRAAPSGRGHGLARPGASGRERRW